MKFSSDNANPYLYFYVDHYFSNEECPFGIQSELWRSRKNHLKVEAECPLTQFMTQKYLKKDLELRINICEEKKQVKNSQRLLFEKFQTTERIRLNSEHQIQSSGQVEKNSNVLSKVVNSKSFRLSWGAKSSDKIYICIPSILLRFHCMLRVERAQY